MGFTSRVAMATAGIVLCVAGAAKATLLGLTQQAPDVTTSFVAITYTASSGALSVSGFPTVFDIDGQAPPDYPIGGAPSYDINLTLSGAGVPTAGGTLVIGGTIAAIGANSGTLLTGTISQFGFLDSPGGENFEFTFTVTGGDLSSYYGPTAGVILDAVDSGFDGTFGSDFANDGFSGSADTFTIVPEPGSAMLLVVAGAALLRRRGRSAC